MTKHMPEAPKANRSAEEPGTAMRPQATPRLPSMRATRMSNMEKWPT